MKLAGYGKNLWGRLLKNTEQPDENDHVRALVAVADLSGFGAWFSNVSDIGTELKPFFNKYESLVSQLMFNNGYFFKDLGDGFLVIKELSNNSASEASSLIKKLIFLEKNVRPLINKTPYPRPTGFRIRMACGHSWKRRRNSRVDYLGRHINLAFKMLRVHKSFPLVMHESVKALMSDKQIKIGGFRLKKMALPTDEQFESIYKHEMSNLWGVVAAKIIKK